MTSSPSRSRLRFKVASVVAVVLFTFHTGSRAQTPTPDALQYANGLLLTGNYVVGGVDLPKSGGVGTINFDAARGNRVPQDADIVAAYLYWETITPNANGIGQATFRGLNIPSAKASAQTTLPGRGAACWGTAGNANPALIVFRADVLQMLPKRLDAEGHWTGKYFVNDADLIAHGLPLHTVTLPQQGTGNVLTQSAGATLVLVYRDPTEPLRKVVFYDGPFAQPEGAPMTQVIRGFYESSSNQSARITHIVGSGAANRHERLFFNGALVAVDPFPAPLGGNADRGWANPTYNVTPRMPGVIATDGYGEIVTTSVAHPQNARPYECLSWAAVVFSTAVADDDRDGIPDGVEDASGGLKDPPTRARPEGQPLPNLNQMGASSSRRDLFVEINAMWAPPGTPYGSVDAPFNTTVSQVIDIDGHNHLPAPEVLKMVGDAYAANGITPHFDVGPIDDYHRRVCGDGPACAVADPTIADQYLVPSSFARGGEAIEERACDATGSIRCQFPSYPGTVGWRFGVQLYQDAPVQDLGGELGANDIQSWSAGSKRRRFDRERQQFFHYLLYAHARGKAKSPLPCLDLQGNPTGYDLTQPVKACTRANPLFHVPSSASGIGDLPGNAALITLGLWDDFTGTPFVQASTTLHELGHNLNLWHGGAPALWGNSSRRTYVEPNCKPNYLSSMNYLFQVHGLFDDIGNLHVDYSGTVFNEIGESSLTDSPLFPAPVFPAPNYQTVWYTPLNSVLATTLGAAATTRYCNGARFDPNAPPAPMARVRALSSSAPIDWNGDGLFETSSPQDVNFDGVLNGPLRGYNDWANVRLDQMGGLRKVRVFSNASGDFLDFGSGDFLDFGSGDFLDFGSGDFLDFGSGTYLVHLGSGDFLDFGSGDFLDFGSGDFLDFGSGVLLQADGDFLDFGSGDFLDFGSGDFLDFGSGDFLDFGSGDFLDFGAGDFLDFGSGNGTPELDYEAAKDLGRTPPHGLTACVIGRDAGCQNAEPFTPDYHRVYLRWNAPTVGHVFVYHVYRVTGNTITASSSADLIGSTAQRTFVDNEELPNGVQFTYFVKAEFDDETPHAISGASNFAVITAENEPPTTTDHAFTTFEDTPELLGNVLTGAVDRDSSAGNVRALVVTPPPHGAVVLNADGSFTYTPGQDVPGHPNDTFTYVANNGTWRGFNVSANSNEKTVTITIISRHTETIVTSPLSPSIYGQQVTFTATVVPESPELGTPSGTLTFKDGNVTLGTALLVNGTATLSTTSLLSAGLHPITARYCDGTHTFCDDKFYGSVSAELAHIVEPAPVTATAGGGTIVYNRETQSPSVCVITPGEGSTYVGALTCSNDPAAVGPNAGTYPIAPAINANGETLSNFAITKVSGSYTIEKKQATATATDVQNTYNGMPVNGVGACSDELSPAITYIGGSAPINVGATAFTVTCGDGGVNYIDGTATGAITISAAAVTITGGGGTSVYDGLAKTPSACVASATAPNTYLGTLTCANDPLQVGPAAGTYQVAPTVIAGTETLSNFAITSVNGSYTIEKKQATATATDVTASYNATAVSGAGSCSDGLTPSITYSGEGAPINANTSTFTVTCGDGGVNYIDGTDEGSITIAKAPVTITAGGGSVTYDGESHSPASCVVSANSPHTYVGALTCSNSVSSVGPAAGSYTITPSENANGETLTNFAITSVNGTYTIAKKQATATATNVDVIYNGTARSGAGSCSDGLTPSISYSGEGAPINAGTSSFTVTCGDGGQNYINGTATGSITIAKAAVKAQAGGGSGEYNAAVQSPSACVVGGISPNTYIGALTCSNDPASVGPAAGAYTISPTLNANGETLSNFAVTTASGTYTITPPPPPQ